MEEEILLVVEGTHISQELVVREMEVGEIYKCKE